MTSGTIVFYVNWFIYKDDNIVFMVTVLRTSIKINKKQ